MKKEKIVSDVIISFTLMTSILVWISLLLWTDYNPGLEGRIIGFAFGWIIGAIVIVLNTVYSWKKMKKGEAVVDERVINIYNKSTTITLHSVYILLAILGMLFFTLYYFGYNEGKILSYTFVFILAGMNILRISIYYIVKSRY